MVYHVERRVVVYLLLGNLAREGGGVECVHDQMRRSRGYYTRVYSKCLVGDRASQLVAAISGAAIAR
jgi:hypothetical protein